MSSTVQQLSPAATANERRFYSRFIPKAPICIAIDGKTEGLLLNISENGLLVSTLTALPCNFVTQISIPLNGLPRPVQVNVRVVWSSEARMLAGIQLINLSEYDREQIRMWGAQTSNSLLPREVNVPSAPVNPPSVVSEKVVTAGLPGAIGSPAKTLPKKPPVLASLNSATMPPQRPAALAEKLLEQPTAAKQASDEEVEKKSEWRKLKWPLIIAGLLLSGLFLLASGALVNPFSQFTENRSTAAPVAPSVLLPEQNPQASLPNTQFARQSPVEDVNSPVGNYVLSSKGYSTPDAPAKTDPFAARDSGKAIATRAASVPAAVPVPRIENARPFTTSPGTLAATKQPEHSSIAARQTVRSNPQAAPVPAAGKLTPAKIVEKPKSATVQTANANSTQKNKSASDLPAAPAVRNRGFIGPIFTKSSSPQTVIASTHQLVEPKALRSPSPPKLALGSSAAIPDITLLPTHEPIETDTSRNTIASNGAANASVATAPLSPMPPNTLPFNAAPPVVAPAIPARPIGAAAKPVTPSNAAPSLSPVIQMDTPGRRVVELRASGDENSFVNIPGERMLQSSSVTMHIQRSVRLPNESSSWLFHRDKEKKVAVGDLVSRVEPQVPASQLAGNDFVQVRARIAADGSVESVRPLHGAQSLVPVVMKAVHGWRFQPTLVDGRAVETQSDVLVQFHPPSPRRTRP